MAEWYETRLGIGRVVWDYSGRPDWEQEAGETVFCPFHQDTDYFGRSTQQWMLNFRVSDMDAMVRQLEALGEKVEVQPTPEPNGTFARLYDPEGNPIELWEPA